MIGLTTPLLVRALKAGVRPETILSAIRNDRTLAFDQTKPGLVPAAEGPLDAARVVQGAIREAGITACDLLRLVV